MGLEGSKGRGPPENERGVEWEGVLCRTLDRSTVRAGADTPYLKGTMEREKGGDPKKRKKENEGGSGEVIDCSMAKKKKNRSGRAERWRGKPVAPRWR